jgi:hypothetical protein
MVREFGGEHPCSASRALATAASRILSAARRRHLGRLFSDGRKDRLIEGFSLGAQVLVAADQACQAVAAGRKARGEAVDGRRRGGSGFAG